MLVSIDHAGRVVIPKALRDPLHLHGGSLVEIIPDGDGLRLRAQQADATFIDKDGVLVLSAQRHSELDVNAFINQQREDHARLISPDSRSHERSIL